MRTIRPRSWLLLAVAIATLASPGCLWTPELSQVRNEIEAGLPGAEYHKQVELSFGPGMLTLARAATTFVHDEDVKRVRGYLRDVSRVQVAVYENRGEQAGDEPVELPQRLRALVDKGWEMVARVNDGKDHVWLLCRSEDETVRDVFVVVMSDQNLVLVKARGHLDRVVARVLEENGGLGWSHAKPAS